MRETDAASIFRALGDANRLRILSMLAGGEKCACKLLEAFSFSQPTLSHHMKSLSACGLVNTRRDGKWSHYSLNAEMLSQVGQFLALLGSGPEGALK